MLWEERKEKILAKLQSEIARGNVDRDIIPLLQLINSHARYVTLSSCSGRIAVLDLPKFGAKRECEFRGKWHERVCVEEVKTALKNCRKEGWLVMQPAILHVGCKTVEDAEKLLGIAEQTGFRESCIISLRKNVVRIRSSERIETILSKNGKILVSGKYLETIVRTANQKLERTRSKIEELKENLGKFL